MRPPLTDGTTAQYSHLALLHRGCHVCGGKLERKTTVLLALTGEASGLQMFEDDRF